MKGLRKFALDRGEINVLIIPLILVGLLFCGAATFGFWAYSRGEDYRLNVEQKVGVAVDAAKKEEGIAKDKEHAEADKQPLKVYVGPEQYGSLRVSFPKTWSGYVQTGSNGQQPLDGYFQPGVVPSTSDQSSTFALRVQIINQAYSTVVTQYNMQVTQKKLTAAAYSLPRVSSVVGIRYEGEFDQSRKLTGSLIVLPIRDKTLKIWAESPTYAADFNTYILPNITFSP